MNTSNRFNIETVARQSQAEISKDLATRHLLKEASLSMLGSTKPKRMVLRLASIILLLFLLLLYFLH